MGYELTEIDIGNLFRILVGKSSTFEGDVRFWFATLPVVAAEPPTPAEPLPVGLPLVTEGDYDAFARAKGWSHVESADRDFDMAGIEAVLKRRADLMRAVRPDLFDPAGRLLPPKPAEPSLTTRTTVRDDRFGDAETWGVDATNEDATQFRMAINREYSRQADKSTPIDDDLATRVALNAVYRRMRARERPAPSGPDPLAEPTEEEAQLARERYCSYDGDPVQSLQHALACFLADRRKHLAPSSAPEPISPAADYMTYHPDRIEFRAKGDGQHDPVVATVSAEAFLRAMRAAAVEKGGEA